MPPMKQTDLGLNLSTKRTRKREFLDEMNRVVPWADLEMLIASYTSEYGLSGRVQAPGCTGRCELARGDEAGAPPASGQR
jgi:hypothetical protein